MQNISFSENPKFYKDGGKKPLSYTFDKRMSQFAGECEAELG